jgi:hypothetical protein
MLNNVFKQQNLVKKSASVLAFSFLGLMTGCGGDSASNDAIAVNQQLNFEVYQQQVNPIFDADIDGKTCSSSGCHAVTNGSGGGLKLYQNAALDSFEMDFNYRVAQSLSNLVDPSQSKLLLEPLAGTFSITGSHAGGDIFPDQSDPNFVVILSWISSPEEVAE